MSKQKHKKRRDRIKRRINIKIRRKKYLIDTLTNMPLEIFNIIYEYSKPYYGHIFEKMVDMPSITFELPRDGIIDLSKSFLNYSLSS